MVDVFIGSISFEERCSSAIRSMDRRFNLGFVFCSEEVAHYRDQHISFFLERIESVKEHATSYQGSINNLRAFQTVVAELGQLINSEGGVNIYWDITTFRRENIALLLLAFKKLSVGTIINVVYADAFDYSVNEEGANKWLSKGVTKVGTVVGYGGFFAANKPFRLVIFLGIEEERIKALIERTEPSDVLFLLPKTSNDRLDIVRLHIFERVMPGCAYDLQKMTHNDPEKTASELLELAKDQSHNYGICSFNSKRSALGFALAALRNQNLRLFYVWAEAYNKQGYSRGSGEVSIQQITVGQN